MAVGLLIAILSCSGSPVDPSQQNVGNTAPWIDVDFEQFESTEDFIADRSVFSVENLHLENVSLDGSVAYTPAGLTRSMRLDWIDQGPNSVSVGRGIRLPTPVDELWVEIPVRWSSNYTPCNAAKPPCSHKLLFLQIRPEGEAVGFERWQVVTGGAGEAGPDVHLTMSVIPAVVPGHQDWGYWGVVRAHRASESDPFQLAGANRYFDESWHILRLHARNSSNAETPDGRMRLWMDGDLIYDSDLLAEKYGSPKFATEAGSKITAILLGRNKDRGRDSGTESVWFGRVRAWLFDPGW